METKLDELSVSASLSISRVEFEFEADSENPLLCCLSSSSSSETRQDCEFFAKSFRIASGENWKVGLESSVSEKASSMSNEGSN